MPFEVRVEGLETQARPRVRPGGDLARPGAATSSRPRPTRSPRSTFRGPGRAPRRTASCRRGLRLRTVFAWTRRCSVDLDDATAADLTLLPTDGSGRRGASSCAAPTCSSDFLSRAAVTATRGVPDRTAPVGRCTASARDSTSIRDGVREALAVDCGPGAVYPSFQMTLWLPGIGVQTVGAALLSAIFLYLSRGRGNRVLQAAGIAWCLLFLSFLDVGSAACAGSPGLASSSNTSPSSTW